jgi:hypothetical protein
LLFSEGGDIAQFLHDPEAAFLKPLKAISPFHDEGDAAIAYLLRYIK